jgi:hypothetical protein
MSPERFVKGESERTKTEKLPRDFKPPHQICSHLKADPAAAARHRQFWQFSVHCSLGNW